jgi:Flp pilus assembly protein TadB
MSWTEPPREDSERHARRRRARASRSRRLARVDLGLGFLLAVVLLLASPGLAIAAIVALLVLLACAISLLIQRCVARRAQRARDANDLQR